MTKLEIDYSLPYEEAKKKYGRNGYFMSKDEYEAAAKKQAKMNAAEEAGNGWWEQEGGPAEEIIKKYGNTTSADIAEQSPTQEQQGIQAKGNPGDNLNNPDALDTSEVTKLHNELKSMEQTKENMEPGTWSNTPEQVEAAKNSAGITKEVPGSTSANNALTDSVAEVTTPNENDTPEEGNSKNQYKKSMMSIWDAYINGLISKETAGYFTIDAIATLAKNLGRSIGNVGAQFSGGTIDNGHDESKWGQRQNALLNETIGKDTESLGGAAARKAESEKFDNILKGYQTNRAATVNDMINDFRDKSKDPSLSETEKRFYQILAVELAGAGLNGSTQIASIGSGVWDDIKSKFGEWFGKKDK